MRFRADYLSTAPGLGAKRGIRLAVELASDRVGRCARTAQVRGKRK
jgi:hypothetical protein